MWNAEAKIERSVGRVLYMFLLVNSYEWKISYHQLLATRKRQMCRYQANMVALSITGTPCSARNVLIDSFATNLVIFSDPFTKGIEHRFVVFIADNYGASINYRMLGKYSVTA